MSIELVLGRHALTLSALRELCVAYDKVNHTHRPPGWDVFRFIAERILRGNETLAEIMDVIDIHKWVEEMEAMSIPPVFNHVTVQATVQVNDDKGHFATGAEDEDSVQPGEDIGSCYDDEPALRPLGADGECKLEMLKEGTDPEDPSSWFSVGRCGDLMIELDEPPPAQSITGVVVIPSENPIVKE